ncbi:hypothetical protein E1N52_39750 [Paraburkholderia guartelaensis]|uniref:DUF3108 domain-containing protein n=1 Tax=Paraburkholderia guartelaensis TaxID=2546446 RepID=A0A4R5L1Q4_9BURK|nr:hypothetical protein [Paraburkholderia guartelaensis]TDG02450.1 hypothetical protein E1N52_39750 [Paraburkholderia guartelaensis]
MFGRVEVKAGTFDAFRVTMRGLSTEQGDTLHRWTWNATFWYAPEVKRVVKSDAVFYARYQGEHHEKFELSEYSLAH